MEVADKLDELSDAKVVGYLEHLLELGRFDEVLHQFPAILTQRPGLRVALEALQVRAREAAELLTRDDSGGLRVDQLRCPGCGVGLDRYTDDAERIVCHHCGTAVDPTSGQMAPGGMQDRRARAVRPMSFVRLGRVASLAGQRRQVVGRLRYEGSSHEWDSEAGTWERTLWQYDEWLLLGEDRSFVYLVEDASGFALADTFVPTSPSLPPFQARRFRFSDSHSAHGFEHGIYKLAYLEGEFGWRAERGELLRSASYRAGPFSYSVEATAANPGRANEAVEEIEFFRGRKLDEVDVLTAFGETEEVERILARRASAGTWFKSAAVFVVCGLLLGAFGLVGGSGNVVLQQAVEVASMPDEGVLTEPVDLDRTGSVHAIATRASGLSNNFAWIGVELLDEARNPLSATSSELWHESGYDSGGYWSESSLSGSKLFRLGDAGRYYLRVHGEGSGTAVVELRQGVRPSRYFLVAGLASIAVGFAMTVFAIRRGG